MGNLPSAGFKPEWDRGILLFVAGSMGGVGYPQDGIGWGGDAGME